MPRYTVTIVRSIVILACAIYSLFIARMPYWAVWTFIIFILASFAWDYYDYRRRRSAAK